MSSSAELNKHALPSPGRTQGDGMETTDNSLRKLESFTPNSSGCSPLDSFLHRQSSAKAAGSSIVVPDSSRKLESFTPNSSGCSPLDSFLHRQSSAKAAGSTTVFPGTIINLSPKYFTQTRKQTLSFTGFKSKEPKFVPYEPYKAAVSFIVPTPVHSRAKHKPHGNVTRTDLSFKGENKGDNISVQSCEEAEGTVTALGSVSEKESVKEKDEDSSTPKPWAIEKESLDAEIKQLKEENGQMELQLKFQAQVNAELKKLLVAAVGEDLQLRVNHLTEDKLQLAHALLNSAKSLSTHQEQTEWLAGQCEVWRSKFLASSLMVEELARWKAALSQKAVDLQDCLRNMLHERSEIHGIMGSTYRELGVLRDNFDAINTVTGSSDRRDASSLNLKDLATACLQTSEVLTLQLLGGAKSVRSRPRPIERHLTVALTPSEKSAEELLQQPVAQLLASGPDVACTAVMGAANALAGKRLFPQISNNVTSCCAHCSGVEKVL